MEPLALLRKSLEPLAPFAEPVEPLALLESLAFLAKPQSTPAEGG